MSTPNTHSADRTDASASTPGGGNAADDSTRLRDRTDVVGDTPGGGPVAGPADAARPFGARLALLVVGLLAVVIAVTGGLTGELGYLATPLAAVGGAIVARAARAVVSTDHVRRAMGSIGVMTGVLVLGASVVATGALQPAIVALTIGIAATTVGVGALVGVRQELLADLRLSVRRSAEVLAVSSVVAAVVYSGILWAPIGVAVSGAAWLITTTPLGAFVALQVLAVATIGAFGLAVPILQRWVSPDEDGPLTTWDDLGIRITEIDARYWAVLAIQVVLVALPPVNAAISWALASIPVLGTVVRFSLVSGILHLPVVVLLILASLVILARGVQWVVVVWVGPNPPRAVASAAGGLVLSALLLPVWPGPIGAAVVSGLGVDPSTTPLGWLLFSVGVAAVGLGGIAIVLGVAYGTLLFGPLLAAGLRVPEGTGTFGVGAALLFEAGTATVVDGATAPVAFIAAAAALLVWDLGNHTVGLVDRVGPTVDVRDVEITHAAASALVGLGGIVLATLAYYLFAWISIPTPNHGPRTFLVMVLAMVALVVFANLIVNVTDETR